jgi:hypothetical protein
MKIRPVGAELFHANRRTDNHDKANSLLFSFVSPFYRLLPIQLSGEADSSFSLFCELAQKADK